MALRTTLNPSRTFVQEQSHANILRWEEEGAKTLYLLYMAAILTWTSALVEEFPNNLPRYRVEVVVSTTTSTSTTSSTIAKLLLLLVVVV